MLNSKLIKTNNQKDIMNQKYQDLPLLSAKLVLLLLLTLQKLMMELVLLCL